MSILLESLNNKANENTIKNENVVPNIHSSHFDEEMLGDDRLYGQLKIWRVTSLILAFFLLVSWSYFLLKSTDGQMKNAEAKHETIAIQKQSAFDKKVTINDSLELSKQAAPIQNRSQNGVSSPSIDQKIATQDSAIQGSVTQDSAIQGQAIQESVIQSPAKQKLPLQPTISRKDAVNINTKANQTVYKPKKRIQNSDSIASKVAEKEVSQVASISRLASFESAIFKEEMTLEQQQEFPDISVNSYVVADKSDKSFVILDGSFYKINQVIAPNLVLRDINRENIIVQFHSQYIKLPLN